MIMQINIGQSEVTLKLLENRKILDPVKSSKAGAKQFDGVDFETAKYYHDLSDVLITGLDKLLRRNKIDLKSLKSYKMHSDLGQDSTSYKIVTTFIGGLQI